MLTELTRLTKEIEGKLVLTELTRLTKEKSESAVLTELTRLTKESRRNRFSPSSLGLQGNVVFTEFTRRPKDFHEILCINRAQSVNTGIIFEQCLPCWVGQ